jgi:hypothetical protein
LYFLKKLARKKKMAYSKKKNKEPKEIIEEIPEALPTNSQKLVLNPDSLTGVASAYRYKLMVMNPELERAAFYFEDSMDVFAFNDVNKKRALKKQDWPEDAPMDHPRRYNVKVQLMAGNAEIKSCGGCSMWKDLTKKPFLILTPHGTRCVEFSKNPFILLIFRCCPKFHSCTKQFSLRIIITHATIKDIVYTNEVVIHRKKMNVSSVPKKRKLYSRVEEEEEEEEDEPLENDCSNDSSSQSPIEKRPRCADAMMHSAQKIEPTVPILSPALEAKSSSDLDSVLALHETLFPNEARLLKPEVSLPSSSPSKKVLAKGRNSHPFQQFQEEYEWFHSQYEQGQQVPQQWGNPQQFFDILFNKKPSKNVLADPSLSVQAKETKKPNTPALEVYAPEISNDEKWLTTVLDDVPFSSDLFRNEDLSLFPFEAL